MSSSTYIHLPPPSQVDPPAPEVKSEVPQEALEVPLEAPEAETPAPEAGETGSLSDFGDGGFGMFR